MELPCCNNANNMFDGWKAENKFELPLPHIIPFVPFLKGKKSILIVEFSKPRTKQALSN